MDLPLIGFDSTGAKGPAQGLRHQAGLQGGANGSADCAAAVQIDPDRNICQPLLLRTEVMASAQHQLRETGVTLSGYRLCTTRATMPPLLGHRLHTHLAKALGSGLRISRVRRQLHAMSTVEPG
jgi:hypothetical protein